MKVERIKALQCIQNERVFYLASISSQVLKNCCFITRRKEDKNTGFQRTLNGTRAKLIKKYMDEDKGCLPTNLILSAQANASVRYDSKASEIIFNNIEDAFMILDGQHRLYGLWMSDQDYSIPVAIFINLKIQDEVCLFIDINTNQKGVNPNLLLDIKGLAGRESELEEKQTQLFNLLNENSPLSGKLISDGTKTGYIAKQVFNDATKVIFETGYFCEKDVDTIYQGLKNYLEAVDLVFTESNDEKAKLTTSNIFTGLLYIFNDCIDKSLQLNKNIKIENLQSILQPISQLQYANYGSNKSGLKKLQNDLKTAINQYEQYRDIEESSIF